MLFRELKIMPGTKAVLMLVIIIINTNKLSKVFWKNRRQSIQLQRMEKCLSLVLGIFFKIKIAKKGM